MRLMTVHVTVLLVVLALGLLPTHTSAALDKVCCRSYIRGGIPLHFIKGYKVQNETRMCPISAIVFYTSKGKACADPALPWVMDRINQLRRKAQIIDNMCPRP